MRVAAGAIARKYLGERLQVRIYGYLSQIGSITAERDQLSGEIKLALDAAEFGNGSIHDSHADRLIAQARALIDRVADLDRRSH